MFGSSSTTTMWRVRVISGQLRPLAGAAAGSVTLNAAPPSSPSTSTMSPPESSACLFAIDRPSPMPCFLNVIVGSNSVRGRLRARVPGPNRALRSRPRAWSDRRDDEHRAAGAGRLGGILQQIGQDAFHQVRPREARGAASSSLRS